VLLLRPDGPQDLVVQADPTTPNGIVFDDSDWQTKYMPHALSFAHPLTHV
jgi:hypothetical protein